MVYDSERNQLGTTAIQLEANTTYFLVVTSENSTVAVSNNTLVEYADGKSGSSAFTYSEETMYLNTSMTGSNNWYYKFTVEVSGTYRIYSHNTGTIDTRGYLYDYENCSYEITYNDDGSQSKVDEGFTGYKWDFYFEYQLEAGVTYYLRVTYNNKPVDVNVPLYVMIENIA